MSYKDKRVKLESKGDLVEVKEGARCESEADALRETEAGAGWTNKARRLGDFSVAGERERGVRERAGGAGRARTLAGGPLRRLGVCALALQARMPSHMRPAAAHLPARRPLLLLLQMRLASPSPSRLWRSPRARSTCRVRARQAALLAAPRLARAATRL